MSYFVRKSEFSVMAGITTPSVSHLVKGRLRPALENGMIDVTHPLVVDYLNGERHPDAKRTGPKSRKDFDPSELGDLPENMQEFATWTLAEIVKKFGTDIRFQDYLKSVKLIEEISERQLKNEERTGQLIYRSMVQEKIFGLIENAFLRILSDSPKTIAIELSDAVKTGETLEQLESRVRELLSKQIKSIKQQAQRALKND